FGRVRSAELQRHRMLARIEAQQPGTVAVQHRAGGQHLGVEHGARGQGPVQDAAMPVCPVHHGGDSENGDLIFQHFSLDSSTNYRRRKGANPTLIHAVFRPRTISLCTAFAPRKWPRSVNKNPAADAPRSGARAARSARTSSATKTPSAGRSMRNSEPIGP